MAFETDKKTVGDGDPNVGNKGGQESSGSNNPDVNDDNNTGDQNTTDKDIKQDKVDYESYKRLLDQKKQRDRELLELRRQQEEIDKKKKLENEQYKQLYEETSEKHKELEKKFGELHKSRIDDFKEAAFLSMLPGDLLKSEYMAHADINEIIFDEDNGSINQDSVKSVVDKFVKNHGHLVKQRNKPELPNDAPGNTDGQKSGKLTYDQWLKLPYKDKKARIKDVIN
jgi:hypothetical protein